MKNKDIFEALGGIDADVVLAAAPIEQGRKNKSFVFKLAAVAACVALLVVVTVLGTLILNRENDDPVNVPDKKVEYVMYMSEYAFGESGTIGELKIPLKPSTEKIFSNTRPVKVDKPEGIPDTIEFTIQGKKYSAVYHHSEIESLFSSEKFSDIVPMSTYIAKDENLNSVCHIVVDAKGTLRTFLSFEYRRDSFGLFTKEDALEEARSIVAELYGEEIFERYPEVSAVYSENNAGRDKTFHVHFEKKIFGMDTRDQISLTFNMSGHLLGITASEMGTMSSAQQDLTQRDIDNAVKAFSETFENADGWTYSVPNVLVIDSEGDYYLCGSAWKDDDEASFGMKIYINVQ